MSSFKFPPPPPPPPKALTNDNQQSYSNQRGGHGQGRGSGDGGRGRGGSRGGSGPNRRGNGRDRGGGSRGGQYNQSQRTSSDSGYGQRQHPALSDPPAQMNAPTTTNPAFNAYSNPPFATPPALDPNAFAQAMSFMATPEGAQSMAAFASHMASTGGSNPTSLPQTQYTPRNYPAPQAGHKRKREDSKGNTNAQHPAHRKTQQQGSKPPRAKAAVPPPVPTFGFALPTPPPAATASKHKDNRKGKVRLGLTRQEAPEESSEEEEEDIDEEAALGAKLKGGGFAFEHQGEQISIQTTGDIAEWIRDRKRNFPTYQKALEKAQAAAAKRKHELDFVRKLKGKPLQPDTAPVEEQKPKVHEKSQKDEKKREELAALRKKLHESVVKKKDATTTVDLGIGYGSASESDAEGSSVLSDSSVLSSSEESSDDSDAESDDSDAPPEAASSKIAPLPINVPPPRRAAIQTEPKPPKEKMCKNWKQYGKCQFGDNCRFKHPYREEKREGLYEKLVEQELVKADQLALDAIKYLGQNGFLG